MKSVIVGTAGHIDHGKSALVKALTGTDPDRLEEEQRRGITIDLGFAHLDTDDFEISFVDVPGHERFVKNMLAGAGGMDLVLFVVAADESIKPQTREHFDICRLLGVKSGLVALTKCDLVESDLRELVKMEVEEFIAGSFLAGAPIVPVSTRTGEGLENLIAELRRLAADVTSKDSSRPFRLPVDRAFVMKGFGPVVTGTMIAGTLERDAEVEIYPTGRGARVRSLQTHHRAEEKARAGQRVAVNLAGIEVSDLARGMTVAEPGRFRPTTRMDVRLHLILSAKPLKHRAPVHFHAWTSESVAEILLPAAQESMPPGATGYAQVLLREPMLLLPGDHFILRQFSPLTTIGGGVVLDNLASRRRRAEDPAPWLSVLESGGRESILEVLLQQTPGGAEAGLLLARTGWPAAELREAAQKAETVSESPWVIVHRQQFSQLQTAMIEEVRRFHGANPLRAGISREELRERVFGHAHPAVFETALARQVRDGKLELAGEIVKQAGRRIVLDQDEAQAKRQIAEAFERAGLAVPPVKEVLLKLPVDSARALRILDILLKEKELVRVTTELVFHRAALEHLRSLLAKYKKSNDRLSVGAFKDLTGITRKYAIPLLEYLDRERITKRLGDERLIL